jgi:hypothetical protein
MKNQRAGMETGWHETWDLPMPECRALSEATSTPD